MMKVSKVIATILFTLFSYGAAANPLQQETNRIIATYHIDPAQARRIAILNRIDELCPSHQLTLEQLTTIRTNPLFASILDDAENFKKQGLGECANLKKQLRQLDGSSRILDAIRHHIKNGSASATTAFKKFINNSYVKTFGKFALIGGLAAFGMYEGIQRIPATSHTQQSNSLFVSCPPELRLANQTEPWWAFAFAKEPEFLSTVIQPDLNTAIHQGYFQPFEKQMHPATEGTLEYVACQALYAQDEQIRMDAIDTLFAKADDRHGIEIALETAYNIFVYGKNLTLQRRAFTLLSEMIEKHYDLLAEQPKSIEEIINIASYVAKNEDETLETRLTALRIFGRLSDHNQGIEEASKVIAYLNNPFTDQTIKNHAQTLDFLVHLTTITNLLDDQSPLPQSTNALTSSPQNIAISISVDLIAKALNSPEPIVKDAVLNRIKKLATQSDQILISSKQEKDILDQVADPRMQKKFCKALVPQKKLDPIGWFVNLFAKDGQKIQEKIIELRADQRLITNGKQFEQSITDAIENLKSSHTDIGKAAVDVLAQFLFGPQKEMLGTTLAKVKAALPGINRETYRDVTRRFIEPAERLQRAKEGQEESKTFFEYVTAGAGIVITFIIARHAPLRHNY